MFHHKIENSDSPEKPEKEEVKKPVNQILATPKLKNVGFYDKVKNSELNSPQNERDKDVSTAPKDAAQRERNVNAKDEKNMRKIEGSSPEERISVGQKNKESADQYIEEAEWQREKFVEKMGEVSKSKLKKKDIEELSQIKYTNNRIIDHMTDRKESIAEARDAAKDKMIEYQKEHDSPRNPSFNSDTWNKLYDTYKGLDATYNKIESNVEKLKSYNNQIDAKLSEGKVAELSTGLQKNEIKQTPGQKIKDFFLARLQKSEN